MTKRSPDRPSVTSERRAAPVQLVSHQALHDLPGMVVLPSLHLSIFSHPQVHLARRAHLLNAHHLPRCNLEAIIRVELRYSQKLQVLRL